MFFQISVKICLEFKSICGHPQTYHADWEVLVRVHFISMQIWVCVRVFSCVRKQIISLVVNTLSLHRNGGGVSSVLLLQYCHLFSLCSVDKYMKLEITDAHDKNLKAILHNIMPESHCFCRLQRKMEKMNLRRTVKSICCQAVTDWESRGNGNMYPCTSMSGDGLKNGPSLHEVIEDYVDASDPIDNQDKTIGNSQVMPTYSMLLVCIHW